MVHCSGDSRSQNRFLAKSSMNLKVFYCLADFDGGSRILERHSKFEFFKFLILVLKISENENHEVNYSLYIFIFTRFFSFFDDFKIRDHLLPR